MTYILITFLDDDDRTKIDCELFDAMPTFEIDTQCQMLLEGNINGGDSARIA